jgi:hypothetical protein
MEASAQLALSPADHPSDTRGMTGGSPEPIDGFRVAAMHVGEALIELNETALTNEEIGRSKSGCQAPLYR